MALTDFRYLMRFRVAFGEIDMLQHANNVVYIKWAETVRCGYFSEVLQETLTGPNSVILARMEFVYERPLDYREEIAIGCRTARLGHKSFDLAYEIWSETRGWRAAHGSSLMVAYNYQAKASQPIPKRWRDVITAYEAVAPLTQVKK
jgi:acyl-CoA thioester hydrolase